jgi:hypothetical protein
MNDHGFTADTDSLTARAAEFPDLAARAGRIHRELVDALAEVGQCWGSDRVGQSFTAVHAEPSDATLGRLGSLTGELGAVGTRLAETSTAYREQDANSAANINAADA